MLRMILFTHRWLGIVVGAVMTLWCLSGFVMMYVDYPRLLPAEQLRGLSPLRLPDVRDFAAIDLPANTRLSSATLEMMSNRPVLRIRPALDTSLPIARMRAMPAGYDLAAGQEIATLSLAQALVIGTAFGHNIGIAGSASTATETAIDQWTVQTFRGHQPLYRIDYADPAGSTAYVAGTSGEVVQQTTRFERFWGWLGAVPHWLYPTILRQNSEAWSQMVIWTSLVSCFLTITGIWIGIVRLRRQRDGSLGSSYRGLWWWHHMLGLFFGGLALTWVASGLLSMNPWGFLDSVAGIAERGRLAGPMTWGDVRPALENPHDLPRGTVRIDAAPLAGTMFVVATTGDGRMVRLDSRGHPAPLRQNAIRAALGNGPPLASLDYLTTEDAYYYTHKVAIKLPVWRAILKDDEQTRLYIDPESGTLIRAIDRNGRRFRWLQDGLHSLDFPGLRQRPVWDLVVLPLLMLVTLLCGTGTWLGIRKLVRVGRRLRRRRGQHD
jgi:uncharacterized iron-regulated membrane protein